MTFGGGITIENGGLSLVDVRGEVAALDPPLVQRAFYLRRHELSGQGRRCRGVVHGHISIVRTTVVRNSVATTPLGADYQTVPTRL